MADPQKRRKLSDGLYKISELSSRLRHWKIRAKVKELLTNAEHQRSFRNKKNSGRKFIYLLEDDSGEIKLKSFGEDAEKLESLNLQMNKEYYVSGAKFTTSDPNFHSYHKYELKFDNECIIEPVEGDHSPCVGTFPRTGKPAGSQADNGKDQFRPIPLKMVLENSKSGSVFDVMGFFKKISKPEIRYQMKSTFYVQKICLTDSTGKVNIGLSAKKKKEFEKLEHLKDQVIGLMSCVWKNCYGQDYINARLDNLYEEHELLETDVQKLMKWDQRPKTSSRKPSLSGKKALEKCRGTKTGNASDVCSPLKEITASQISAREATDFDLKETLSSNRKTKRKGKKSGDKRAAESEEDEVFYEDKKEEAVSAKKKHKNTPTQINTKKVIKGRESTEEEKAEVVIVISSDSELSGHSNSDDEVIIWEKEDVERKKPAKKNLKKAEERRKNVKQRPTTGKGTLEPEKKKREIKDKAKSVTTRLACTHPFSKGTHKQRDVMSSEVKTKVSRSIGLIHIDGHPAGTGFRVGEKNIVTCLHVINCVIKVFPNFIDCERINIEFERKKYNKKENPHQIFHFQPNIAYLDDDVDCAVLELVCHYADVPFPPALTYFGDVCDSEIHFVGHPGGRQMKEDSDVFPKWSPNHNNEIIPYINELAEWSKSYFPMVKGEGVDYYSILLEPPRKILFHTSFDEGSSGSPGVMIRDDEPCVVVMLSGGTPSCYYQGLFPDHPVEDHKKIEYGYAISNIYERMRDSGNQKACNLAEEIFKKWIC